MKDATSLMPLSVGATRHRRPQPEHSIVIPVFNEETVIPWLHPRMAPVMAAIGLPWEAIYGDDGPQDRSPAVSKALRLRHPEISVVSLSRNFGKEAAMTAGLAHARASGAIAVIDVDLQNPPEAIPNLFRSGTKALMSSSPNVEATLAKPGLKS